jgi:starch phosphorylase
METNPVEATVDAEMMNDTENLRELPEPLEGLQRICWNYWWSWAYDGSHVFRDLEPTIWENVEHNPRTLLTDVDDYRLLDVAIDPVYLGRVARLCGEFDRYLAATADLNAGFAQYGISPAHPVAYFCAEYGIHHSLPLYSGGLGILAGDHLKSASDLGVPLVAVGLLYRFGYFRQRLTREGWQSEEYLDTEPNEIPVTAVRDEQGEPIIVEVQMRGRTVSARAWRADVGRVQLYLLDTNIPENNEIDRLVTGHLYGGDRETRVVQEMMLGIGGVRLLRKLGVEPAVYHLNEGHSAFLTLELAREHMVAEGVDFAGAVGRVRERCVFTTHTPVAAGNDDFPAELIEKCFGDAYEKGLGLSHDAFLDLGRVDTDDDLEHFGLTPLAIRMCRSTNGVSAKHGEVSRRLWREMFPAAQSDAEVPITSVTNGVHAPTWISPLLGELLSRQVGADWQQRLHDAEGWAASVANIQPDALWKVHNALKRRMVAFVRDRSHEARVMRKESAEYIEAARELLNPEALTIGFARRVAGYKRWNLLLTDTARLIRLINNPERPVQFVFAGKAHPQDQGAKLILQQVAMWKYDPRVMQSVVFIQDYEQEIAKQMVQSVDVWLNVPRRPMEASGTSGEKVGLNGGLNLSILDGWWIEGYDRGNGWAIGGLSEGTEDAQANVAIDASDAESLYRVLEEEVVPIYYDRGEDGLPHGWIQMMKHAIATLAPAFNSDRMVMDYVQRIYTK